MEECAKCSRNEAQVKLLDAIYGNEIVKICEECSISENIPIIRRPSSFQLSESEKPYSVRQRLSKMAGVPFKTPISKQEEVKPKLNLDNIRPAKDYSRIIEARMSLARKSNAPVNLIDNFNWHIQQARRSRKLTIGQVAEVIGESESVLKMIEQGSLVDDSSRIINKLEQYFKINLRKSEENGALERIERAKESVKMPARVLSFDAKSMDELKIDDLKRMKEERERAEKKEREFSIKKEEKSREEKEKNGIMDMVWKGIGRREKKPTEDEVLGKSVEFEDD